MAEFIAARVGKSVCEGENEGDGYISLSLASIFQPHQQSCSNEYVTLFIPNQPFPPLNQEEEEQLTNKRQPDKLKANQRYNREQDPQHRLRIQRDPKEAFICSIDFPLGGIRALKHPSTVARRAVNLVPPPQPDQAPSRDVLEVVEVGGEEEDGYDEDEDEVGGEEAEAEEVNEEGCCGLTISICICFFIE